METADESGAGAEERGVTDADDEGAKRTTTTRTQQEETRTEEEQPPQGAGDASGAEGFDPSGGAGEGLQAAPEDVNPDVPAADREAEPPAE